MKDKNNVVSTRYEAGFVYAQTVQYILMAKTERT